MAQKNKRMFSKDIIDDENFLELPLSTQALYFHLGMNADDDGFVNHNKVMRNVGTNKNDLDLLKAKNYLMVFSSNTSVVLIKHWKINNYIRKDRYYESKYKELGQCIFVKDNLSYTFDETQANTSMYPLGIPDGTPVVCIDKNRLDKNRLDKNRSIYSDENICLLNYEYTYKTDWCKKKCIKIEECKLPNKKPLNVKTATWVNDDKYK